MTYYALLTLILLNCFILLSFDSNNNSNPFNQNVISIPPSPQFTPHAPILIESDGNFSSYNFSGAGTRNNPYLITDYSISSHGASAVGIEISNTNSFFIINSCVIFSDYIGILLSNIPSGQAKITNNRIYGDTEGGGIILGNLENCTISNNFCEDFMQGIHLNSASECLIIDNSIYYNSYQGINIRYSDSNVIIYNQILHTQEHGIALVGTSHNNIIHHNILEGNMWSSTYDIDGVPKGKPMSQAYDEGSQNTWYDIQTHRGNIWSDYFGVGAYKIDGPANSIDLYPECSTRLTPFIMIISIMVIVFIIMLTIFKLYIRTKRKRINLDQKSQLIEHDGLGFLLICSIFVMLVVVAYMIIAF
jgi:parallel beta-helix repeat protein